MISLEEARERILAAVLRLEPRETPTNNAAGEVPAETVFAQVDLPPFDNSSVDGYAVRAADLASASDAHPVTLRVAALLPAGIESLGLPAGTCARIFTGSMLPPGADAVVMQEDVETDPTWAEGAIFKKPALPWENIRFRGEDVKQGAPLAKRRVWLGPAQIGLLAAAGVANVRIHPRPVIGLIATGDELREPGAPLVPGLIYESNRYSLAALAKRFGARAKVYPIVPDDLAATKTALETAFGECDAVATIGGVSVGERDFVKAAFTELGGQIEFWKVAIKPGRPFVFGQWRNKLLFGLPGNPVSAFVTFFLLAIPALRKMWGDSKAELRKSKGILAEPLENDGERRHFMRVVLNDKREVRLAGPQASHRLLSLAAANGLVDVPPQTTLAAGAGVEVLCW